MEDFEEVISFALQVEEWKKTRPNDFIFFRPQTEEEDPANISHYSEVGEDDVMYHEVRVKDKDPENSLLFIHISENQLKIWRRWVSLTTGKLVENALRA